MSDAESKHVESQLSVLELTLYDLSLSSHKPLLASESLRRNLLIPKQLFNDVLHVEIL